MKKRWILLLLVLVLISSVNAAIYTNKKIPTIIIPFNEETVLTNVSVLSPGGDELTINGPVTHPVAGLPVSDTWKIEVKNTLIEETYILAFTATDTFSNVQNYELELIIDLTEPEIESLVVQPSSVIGNSLVVKSSTPTVYVTLNEPGKVNKALLKNGNLDLIELLQNFYVSDDGASLSALLPMTPGQKTLFIEASDLAGNIVKDNITFYVQPEPMEVSLIEPPFGVANEFTFDVMVETNDPSDLCKYSHIISPTINFASLNSPANFLVAQYDSDVLHKLTDFNGITQEKKPYKMYVFCNSSSGLIMQEPEIFDLEVDTSAPSIVDSYADPAFVIELPEVDLVVETDDETRCKYDAIYRNFTYMEFFFDDYDEDEFKLLNTQKIEGLGDESTYSYYVACENKALDYSSTANITFNVNFSAQNQIIHITPAYSNTSSVNVELKTNKIASCQMKGGVLGDNFSALSTEDNRIHTVSLSSLDDGSSSFIVTCGFATGPVEQGYTLIVDTTAPDVEFVEDFDVSVSKSRLKYEINATDNESGINHYLYAVGSVKYPSTNYSGMINWTTTSSDDGRSKDADFEVGETYYFAVKAVNNVGLVSSIVASDGVLVDPSYTEDPIIEGGCFNGILDIITGETATDCGGLCSGCADGLSCNLDNDCLSGTCNLGVCSSALTICNNLIKDENETDIDCGGVCNPCFTGKSCLIDSDCVSNNCTTSVCQAPLAADTDGDGMPDDWEMINSLDYNNPNDKYMDPDNDGLLNIQEFEFDADPKEKDTDGDGIYDGGERTSGTNMLDALSKPADADNDAVDDSWELENGLSFNSAGDSLEDSDKDGFTSLEEYNYNTYLDNPDTDNDGIYDGGERTSGTDPVDVLIVPVDVDKDLMGDDWEKKFGLDVGVDDAQKDKDLDEYSNIYEYLHNTNPADKKQQGPLDSDGDGYTADKDCDDTNPKINPSEREIIGNGWDDDCDPETSDERGPVFFLFSFIFGLLILLGSAGFLLYRYKTFFKPIKQIFRQPPKRPVQRVVKRSMPKKKRSLFEMPKEVSSKDLDRFRKAMEDKRTSMGDLFDKFGPKTKRLVELHEKKKKEESKFEAKPENITYFDLSALKKKIEPKKKDKLFDDLDNLRERAVKQKKPRQEEAFDKLSKFLGGDSKSDLDALKDEEIFDELVKTESGKDVLKKLRKIADK
jgi:hypothetical protein